MTRAEKILQEAVNIAAMFLRDKEISPSKVVLACVKMAEWCDANSQITETCAQYRAIIADLIKCNEDFGKKLEDITRTHGTSATSGVTDVDASKTNS